MTLLNVKVVPGARRSEVAGRYGEGVKIRVAAPPEDGRANRALIETLAEALGVKPASIRVVRGHTSPQKVVEIDGIEPSEIWRRLGAGA